MLSNRKIRGFTGSCIHPVIPSTCVHGCRQGAARRAGEPERVGAGRPCGRHRDQNVVRPAAGADADDRIRRRDAGGDLPDENLVETVVVGDACDSGNIGGQSDGRERGTFAFIPPDELGGQVSRIRSAASVAEEQHFVSVAKSRGDQLRNLHDAVGILVHKLLLDACAFRERAENTFFHENRF